MQNVEVRHSGIQGLGVFATGNIGRGEWILTIDDSRTVTPDNPLREDLGESAEHQDYFPNGTVTLMQFPERHINHSCYPNCYTKTIDGKRHVFALRDIAAGEEVAYDYCINGFGNTLWYCNCGAPSCRREIHSDYFHLPLHLQVKYLPLLDDYYLHHFRDKVEDLKRKVGGLLY